MITSLTEYAGFWRRFMAFLVDALWMYPLVLFLLYFIDNNDYTNLYNSFDNFDAATLLEQVSQTQIEWKIFLIEVLIEEIVPAILILWFWTKYAATPGKLLFDCKIVDANSGKPINFKQALLRYIGYLISALPLGLGYLWIIWDKRKQGWHDKIAGTVVIIHDEATVPLHQLEKYSVETNPCN